jgi:hypothetical protein
MKGVHDTRMPAQLNLSTIRFDSVEEMRVGPKGRVAYLVLPELVVGLVNGALEVANPLT